MNPVDLREVARPRELTASDSNPPHTCDNVLGGIMIRWRAVVLVEGRLSSDRLLFISPGAVALPSRPLQLYRVMGLQQFVDGTVDRMWREGALLWAEGTSRQSLPEGWLVSVALEHEKVESMSDEGLPFSARVLQAQVHSGSIGAPPRVPWPEMTLEIMG